MEIIEDVYVSDKKIVIRFESGRKKVIKAKSSGYSRSEFLGFNYKKMLNRGLVDIEMLNNEELRELEPDHDDVRHKITFVLDNGNEISTYMINYSNGYYSGYIRIEDK